MAAPFTESARNETPHKLHANLISIDSFRSPERLLAPQDKNTTPDPPGSGRKPFSAG
jgi:hypothetical protein